MSGIITNIQRFSLNDGPGIRTTVFFQGCNMNCKWCHNPEAISFKPVLLQYANKCIGCGKCFSVCPKNAHKLKDNRHIIDRLCCVGCGKCASLCYAEALVMSGKIMSAEEVMAEVLQDKLYYKESGGGVTLSGGEALCQTEFADELIEACRVNDIHVAVESNMLLDFEKIKTLLTKLNLIMLDVKLIDDEEHKKWVGVSNKQVIKNIQKVSSLGVPIIVRTPLIPGVTDTAENLKGIADFVSTLDNVLYYELLNFNPLGEAKYKALNCENHFENARSLPQSRLSEIISLLSDVAVKVHIR